MAHFTIKAVSVIDTVTKEPSATAALEQPRGRPQLAPAQPLNMPGTDPFGAQPTPSTTATDPFGSQPTPAPAPSRTATDPFGAQPTPTPSTTTTDAFGAQPTSAPNSGLVHASSGEEEKAVARATPGYKPPEDHATAEGGLLSSMATTTAKAFGSVLGYLRLPAMKVEVMGNSEV